VSGGGGGSIQATAGETIAENNLCFISTGDEISESIANNGASFESSMNGQYASCRFIVPADVSSARLKRMQLPDGFIKDGGSGVLSGTITYAVYALSAGGFPTGPILETSSSTLNSSLITGTPFSIELQFANTLVLTPGTVYGLVVNASGVTSSGSAQMQIRGENNVSSTYPVALSPDLITWAFDLSTAPRIIANFSYVPNLVFRVPQGKTTPIANYSFDGIATSSVVATNPVTLLQTGTKSGYVGLTNNSPYYSGVNGALSTVTTGILIGTSTSATTLLIGRKQKFQIPITGFSGRSNTKASASVRNSTSGNTITVRNSSLETVSAETFTINAVVNPGQIIETSTGTITLYPEA